jgi:radical SAM protein with 4Fe4S-binding SPASM domain
MSEQVVQPTSQYAESQIVIDTNLQREEQRPRVKTNMRKYAWYVFRQFYEYNHRYTRLNTLPQIAEIEVTDNCNLRCRFCSRDSIEKHRGIGFMGLGQFKLVLDKCKGHIVSPSLSMHGEPTLHPNLPEMVRLTKEGGAKSVSITSNGTLLNGAKFKELVDAGLDGIEVSFEGTDKESYEYQRVGARYDVVKENLLRMMELKETCGFSINLGINIIDNQITHEKLPDFVEYWSERGFRVDVAQLIDWAGTSDQDFFGKAVRQETYQHPFGKFKVCPMPWFFVGIDYNGWVVPCCHWLSEPMGNIFEEPIETIWNGPKYIALRKLMLKGGRHAHDYCAKCWDGSMRTDSPYFHEPNRAFPFTRQFYRNMKVFMRWSTQKEYAPTREVKRKRRLQILDDTDSILRSGLETSEP